MDNKELLELIIGPGSIERLVGALIYAYIGAFLFLMLSTTKRDPNSERTPEHFSWKFLFNDNSKRILATIILIFIFVRFARELLGADITMYAALLIGFGCDKLSEFLKNRNILNQKTQDHE